MLVCRHADPCYSKKGGLSALGAAPELLLPRILRARTQPPRLQPRGVDGSRGSQLRASSRRLALPVEVVIEAMEYVRDNQVLLADEREREYRLLRDRGVLDQSEQ